MKDFAEAVTRGASTVVARYERRLEALGMRAVTSLHDWSEGEFLDVELRVDVLRGDDLIDFFEDFVIKQGEPIGTVQQIDGWVRNGLDDVLNDLTSRRSG